MPDDIAATELEAYKAYVGRSVNETDLVGAPLAARFAATLGRPHKGAALPPMWHYGLFLTTASTAELGSDGHPPRGVFMPPVSLPRRMFAGSDIRFMRPLMIGQEVVRCSRIAAVDHRRGKSGDLVFVCIAIRLSQAGAVCIEEEQTIVYCSGSARRSAVVETTRRPLTAGEIAEEWRPTTIELFRFSSATFNAHRVHYDRPYAIEEEGYPSLVVHGPLIATRLCDFAERIARKNLARFTFRSEAPAFVEQPIRFIGSLKDGACVVLAERADGITAMSAVATLS
ncbi:MAG TPA: hypothetical protein VFT61_11000 [Sphingomicrobium sp.]|nr:hypothetical protein [Sphingomicrobium sp.]